MFERIKRSSPLAILLASVLTLYHRLLLGDVLFWGLPMLQFYPWQKLAFDQIRQGQVPLWNPLLGNGAPLLANYQTAVFYPVNWLYLIIPTEHAMGIIALLHVVWAGVGMRVYLRRLRLGSFAQSIGMLSFALGSYMISRFAFLTVTAAVSWLPWVMWSVEGVLSEGGQSAQVRRKAVLLAMVIGLQLLAGHAQTTFYSMVMAVAYALFRLYAGGDRPAGVHPRLTIVIALSAVLGILIAAVQLIPTAELWLSSQRAGGMQRVVGLAYSFWPWRLLTLIAPNLFGSPATNNFDGYGAYWEDAIYVGLLPLVMAGHGIIGWLRERTSNQLDSPARVVPFFLLVLPIAFILALGKDSAVFVWLFDHKVPGFSTFQAPTRWMLLAVFSLSVHASYGIDTWQSSDRGMFWTRLLTAGGFSFVIAALGALQLMGAAIRLNFVPAILWLGIWVIVGGVLGLLQPQAEQRSDWRPLWETAVLLFVAADLVVANWGLTPTIESAYYHRASQLADAVRHASPGGRTFYLPKQEVEVKFAANTPTNSGYLSLHAYDASNLSHWYDFRNSLLPDLGVIDGVPSSNNFDPLLIGAYSLQLDRFGSNIDASTLDMLQKMGVSVLLTPESCGDLTLMARTKLISACRLPDPWPRASLANCSDANALGEVTCSGIDVPLQIVSETPSHVVISASVDKPKETVLLLDTFYLGWVAYVDGQPVQIFRANSIFRGVEVGQGPHTIEFKYDPLSFKIGVGVTAIALVVVVAVWFTSRK